jgi:hypothetical protein
VSSHTAPNSDTGTPLRAKPTPVNWRKLSQVPSKVQATQDKPRLSLIPYLTPKARPRRAPRTNKPHAPDWQKAPPAPRDCKALQASLKHVADCPTVCLRPEAAWTSPRDDRLRVPILRDAPSGPVSPSSGNSDPDFPVLPRRFIVASKADRSETRGASRRRTALRSGFTMIHQTRPGLTPDVRD